MRVHRIDVEAVLGGVGGLHGSAPRRRVQVERFRVVAGLDRLARGAVPVQSVALQKYKSRRNSQHDFRHHHDEDVDQTDQKSEQFLSREFVIIAPVSKPGTVPLK